MYKSGDYILSELEVSGTNYDPCKIRNYFVDHQKRRVKRNSSYKAINCGYFLNFTYISFCILGEPSCSVGAFF